MKLGFDIHGVIDTFDVFSKIIDKFIDDPDIEIHVISGLERVYLEEQIGHLVDIKRVYFFSVTDHLVETGKTVTWVNGLPWAEEEDWNKTKAEYCAKHKIDILFDDSPVYAPYFDSIDTIYCQIHNNARKQYKTR